MTDYFQRSHTTGTPSANANASASATLAENNVICIDLSPARKHRRTTTTSKQGANGRAQKKITKDDDIVDICGPNSPIFPPGKIRMPTPDKAALHRKSRLCLTQEDFERREGYLALKHQRMTWLRAVGSLRDRKSVDACCICGPGYKTMFQKPLQEISSVLKVSAYTCHLRYIMHTICCKPSMYRHLFRRAELDMAEKLLQLSDAGLGLLARLFSRKGPWFHIDSILDYSEIYPSERKEPVDNALKVRYGEEVVKELERRGLLLTLEEISSSAVEHDEERILEKYTLLGSIDSRKSTSEQLRIRRAVCALVCCKALKAAGVVAAEQYLSKLMSTSVYSLASLEICATCLTVKQIEGVCSALGLKTDPRNNIEKFSSRRSMNVSRIPLLPYLESVGFPSDTIPSILENIQASSNDRNEDGVQYPTTKRALLLSWILERVVHQKDVWGSELPLGRRMREVILHSKCSMLENKGSFHSVQFFRFPRALRHILLRIHRLFYLVGNTASLSSGRVEGEWTYGTNNMQKQLELTLITDDGCRSVDTGAIADNVPTLDSETIELGPPSFSPGLLTVFRKIAYASYKYFLDICLFPVKESYFIYEAGLAFRDEAIRTDVLMRSSQDSALNEISNNPIDSRNKFSQLIELFEPISGREIFSLLYQPLGQNESDLVKGTVLQDLGAGPVHNIGRHALATVLNIALEYPALRPNKQCDLHKSFYKLCMNFLVGYKFPELLIAMRASCCLHIAHCLKATDGYTDQLLSSSDSRSSLSQTTGYVYDAIQKNSGHNMDHLQQLEGSPIFVSIIWDVIDRLERRKLYSAAVIYLRQLLSLPYTPHRRGKWWIRLSLDLDHMRLRKESIHATMEGCCDSSVRGGDKITLWKRLCRQQKQLTGELSFGVLSAINSMTEWKPHTDYLCSLSDTFQECSSYISSREESPLESDKSSLILERLKNTSCIDFSLRSFLAERLPFADLPVITYVMGPLRSKIQECRIKGCPISKTVGSKSRFVGTDAFNDFSCRSKEFESVENLMSGQTQITDYVWLSMAAWLFLLGCIDSDANGESQRRSVYKLGDWLLHTIKPLLSHIAMHGCTVLLQAHAVLSNFSLEVEHEEMSKYCSVLAILAVNSLILWERNILDQKELKNICGGPTLSSIEVNFQSMFGEELFTSVEVKALEHYAKSGWRGHHCEGRPLYSIFALLFWDIIFDGQVGNGVFVTSYQDAPLDIDTPSFLERRKASIMRRLQYIAGMEEQEVSAFICARYIKHYGCVCRGMSWHYPVSFLQLIACGLGTRVLSHVCYALCANHKHLNGGLPDLLLWRVLLPHSARALQRHEGKRCYLTPIEERSNLFPDLGWSLPEGSIVQAKLVEVKGPRDRLSDKQNAWLNIFASAGADVEVCYIEES